MDIVGVCFLSWMLSLGVFDPERLPYVLRLFDPAYHNKLVTPIEIQAGQTTVDAIHQKEKKPANSNLQN